MLKRREREWLNKWVSVYMCIKLHTQQINNKNENIHKFVVCILQNKNNKKKETTGEQRANWKK